MLIKLKKSLTTLRRPSLIRQLAYDYLGKENSNAVDYKLHLRAACEWLFEAQDSNSDNGVSAGFYYFKGGWLSSYPETTGYIIPSIIKSSEVLKNNECLNRAEKMADWEVSIQLDDGAFPGAFSDDRRPRVFDVGQIILGLVAIYESSKKDKYIQSAIRAGDWLINNQDNNGSWVKNTHNHSARAYHSRVAWPLFKLFEILNDQRYKVAAQKNIDWVLSNKKSNFWIDKMGFIDGELPLTHTIIYTFRGLLESSVYLEKEYQIIVYDLINNLIRNIKNSVSKNYTLYGIPLISERFDENWVAANKNSCIPGNAQLCALIYRFEKIFKNNKYRDFSDTILNQIMHRQILNTKDKTYYGAIPTAYPFWRGYGSYCYVNWTNKFFIDAINYKLTSE